MLPFISRSIRLFISTAYSNGSSFDTLLAKPLTIIDRASSSLIPAMDIRTGDADVGHEAKIGRISDDAVFYLMSRGISEEEARSLMRPILASCPTSASPVRMSIAGIVSDLEMSSSISD